MSTIYSTKPSDFGLPARFDPWRENQEEAVWAALNSQTRFMVINAPTGFGKSLLPVAMQRISGLRVLILTSTKGQQDQYREAFSGCGLVDPRGMANYVCDVDKVEELFSMTQEVIPPGPVQMCDKGPCLDGYQCKLREGGCRYFDHMRMAAASFLVCTNYACWLADRRRAQPLLGCFDIIVMDEAHDAEKQLANYLKIEIKRTDFELLLGEVMPCDNAAANKWPVWAGSCLLDIESMLAEITNPDAAMRRQMKRLRNMGDKLAQVMLMRGEWVAEEIKGVMTFEPVSPADYGDALYGGCSRIVMISATAKERTAMGIGAEADEITLHEYPSSFPVARRPVYYCPTIQYSFRSTPDELRGLWRATDNFMRPRIADMRKGIIHTVSYKRMREVYAGSKEAVVRMHEAHETSAVVESFKQGSYDASVLASPALSTGWNFPDDECRFILIPKLPYPDTQSKIMKARIKADPLLIPWIISQELQQMTGRGMRSQQDWCECAIFDENFSRFWRDHRGLMAEWWKEAVVWCKKGVLPEMLHVDEEDVIKEGSDVRS